MRPNDTTSALVHAKMNPLATSPVTYYSYNLGTLLLLLSSYVLVSSCESHARALAFMSTRSRADAPTIAASSAVTSLRQQFDASKYAPPSFDAVGHHPFVAGNERFETLYSTSPSPVVTLFRRCRCERGDVVENLFRSLSEDLPHTLSNKYGSNTHTKVEVKYAYVSHVCMRTLVTFVCVR